MDLKAYLETWKGARAENRFSRAIIVALLLVVVVQAIALYVKDTTVVLVPAGMDTKGEVSSDSADPAMQASWGIFIATILGNITPQSADAIPRLVAPYLHPSIHHSVIAQITDDAAQIKREDVTAEFSPAAARWEPSINAVLVSGDSVLRGPRGDEKRQYRTYMLRFGVQNHRVTLRNLRVVDGAWEKRMGGFDQ